MPTMHLLVGGKQRLSKGEVRVKCSSILKTELVQQLVAQIELMQHVCAYQGGSDACDRDVKTC